MQINRNVRYPIAIGYDYLISKRVSNFILSNIKRRIVNKPNVIFRK